jgi:hypothetical protein
VPGTSAPVASLTVPRIVPVGSCAKAKEATATIPNNNEMNRNRFQSRFSSEIFFGISSFPLMTISVSTRNATFQNHSNRNQHSTGKLRNSRTSALASGEPVAGPTHSLH